jgi:hypothetical protein
MPSTRLDSTSGHSGKVDKGRDHKKMINKFIRVPGWLSLLVILAPLSTQLDHSPRANAQFMAKPEDRISITPALQAELKQAAEAEELAEAKLGQAKASKLATIYKAYAVSKVGMEDFDIVREPNGSFHFQRKPPEKKPEMPAKP